MDIDLRFFYTQFTKHTHNTKKYITRLSNLLLPQHCVLCHCVIAQAPHNVFCLDCLETLPRKAASCSQCDTPLATNSELCGVCLTQNRHWQQCYAAYAYQQPINSLIHQFKYEHKTYLTDTFANHISCYIEQSCAERPDVFIPVPMHKNRLAKRGYNQSLRLTKALSKNLNIPWQILLVKTRDTAHQVDLNSKSRQKALKNSFSINPSISESGCLKKHIPKKHFSGKHIVIVDDVVTTGSTTSEMAKVLKKAGARAVDVWCIART